MKEIAAAESLLAKRSASGLSKLEQSILRSSIEKARAGDCEDFNTYWPRYQGRDIEETARREKEGAEEDARLDRWAASLGKGKTIDQLNRELAKLEAEQSRAASSRLRALDATTSMSSQSQRRAQTGNVVRGNYELKRAIMRAIELKDIPQHAQEETTRTTTQTRRRTR